VKLSASIYTYTTDSQAVVPAKSTKATLPKFKPAYTIEAWNFTNKTNITKENVIAYINKTAGVAADSTDIVSASVSCFVKFAYKLVQQFIFSLLVVLL
jgi:quinolinate synthase